MQIFPLTPTLGAEISGVDVRRLDDVGIDTLRRTWLQYKVKFLREQDLDLDELQQLRWRATLFVSHYHCRCCATASLTFQESVVLHIDWPISLLRAQF